VWSADAPALRLPPNGVAGLLSLVFFTFWFGPLPEEIGWRGFAQDRLQARWSPLLSSLVIGLVWALWHVPLFFVPGTFQHQLGWRSPRFWIFSASLIPLSIVMTWVYNRAGRSTLAAALIHFSGNLCGALIPKTTQLAGIELLLLIVCACCVLAIPSTGQFSSRRSTAHPSHKPFIT
jgi:membrane protease YdiL (CAAX protease family)